MKKVYLSIFWKFTISIIFIVGIFGSINLYLIQKSVISSLQEESEKRAKYIAFNVATQALDPLLFEDYIALQKIIDNVFLIDSSVQYAFIIIGTENPKIIHNFPQNIPELLVKANKLGPNSEFRIRLISTKKSQEGIIRDIAVPILNRELGIVRIGIKEDSIKENAQSTLQIFIMMVGIFLFLGIIGAFVFSKYITKPIKELSSVAENLDLDKLSDVKRQINELNSDKSDSNYIYLADEMDMLYDKFFTMIERLKDAYKEIDITYSKLIHSEKLASIGTLSAGIAHEINNPNTGIQYCIRILKKDLAENPKNSNYLEMMEEASQKIENVVKGLLEYSRPQIFEPEEIVLRSVIEKSFSFVNYKLEKQNIIFENNIEDKELTIYGSSHHLEQVFVNLFINSIDAIDERKKLENLHQGRIIFEIEIKEKTLDLKFTDNGIGIKTENLKDIFDPFYTSKEVGKGTGLGLSVSSKIINSHKGTMSVSSEYLKGTTFTISLPKEKDK